MEFARRPVQQALTFLGGALRGKFGKKQGHSMGGFPMNGKRGPRNFYKGKNARNLGYISSKARFFLQDWKIPQLIVPDLSDTDLKPYVAYKTPKIKAEEAQDKE